MVKDITRLPERDSEEPTRLQEEQGESGDEPVRVYESEFYRQVEEGRD